MDRYKVLQTHLSQSHSLLGKSPLANAPEPVLFSFWALEKIEVNNILSYYSFIYVTFSVFITNTKGEMKITTHLILILLDWRNNAYQF
jgi:hypothetical protein